MISFIKQIPSLFNKQETKQEPPPEPQVSLGFDELVDAYITCGERCNPKIESQLQTIKSQSLTVRQPEVFVRKSLSIIRLDQAINEFGKCAVVNATHEFFIDNIHSGKQDFQLKDLKYRRPMFEGAEERILRDRKFFNERIIRSMQEKFPKEIVDEHIEPSHRTGEDKIDSKHLEEQCKTTLQIMDEQIAHELSEKLQKEQKDALQENFFNEKMTEVYSATLKKVWDHKPAKFNRALIQNFIHWVVKSFPKPQGVIILSQAFANMGIVTSENLLASDALKIAKKIPEPSLAKTDPYAAFQKAVLVPCQL